MLCSIAVANRPKPVLIKTFIFMDSQPDTESQFQSINYLQHSDKNHEGLSTICTEQV